MPSSCREIRAELAKCMQKSDCVLINRHSVADCMKDKDLFDTQVPDECHRLRRSFFNCRRGLVCPCLMRICGSAFLVVVALFLGHLDYCSLGALADGSWI